MIKVEIDQEQKLVEAEITGLVKAEEAARFSNEIKKTITKFAPGEAGLVINMVGFMPMSNDVLSLLRGMGRDVIGYFRKAALVQEFASQMPGRKYIEPPPGKSLPAFATQEEALRYLAEDS